MAFIPSDFEIYRKRLKAHSWVKGAVMGIGTLAALRLPQGYELERGHHPRPQAQTDQECFEEILEKGWPSSLKEYFN
jgi:hypothetical protein